MAIRIPKRSGAAESVGGKTIRIPRGTIEQPKVRAGNNAMLSAVQSNKINYDKLTNTIDAIGTRIQAHNRRIEEQRIDNFNTTNTSLLKGDINQELENIKNNLDLQTNGDYNLTWDTFSKKLETKYKKLYKGDDDAFAKFESTMYTAFNDGQSAMWKERRKKVLAEAQINFNSATQEFKDDLDKQDVTPNIWLSTDLLLKKEKERFIKAKALGITVDWVNYQTEVNDMVWKKVITANHQYTDTLTGKIEIDYLKVYNDLTASKSTQTWFGKKMDRDTKNSLSAWANKKHDEQKGILTETHARINNDRTSSIDKQILEYDAGNFVTPDGSHPYTWLKNQVLTLQITSDRKDALMDEINKVYKRQPTDISQGGTYGNPITMDKYIDMIMSNEARGQIFIDLVKNDKDLSPQGKKWIVDYAKTWNTGIDKKSQDLIKEFVNNFPKISADLPKQLVPFVGMARFEVSRVVDLLVAEAQKSGIAINELFSRKSIHFIGDKLMDVYSGSLIENMSKNYNMMTDKTFDSKMFWDAKYNEVISAFIDADPDDPKKPETIGQHLKIDKVPIKDEEGNVTGYKNVIDREYAIFFQRLLTKPMPPEPTKIGINMETIEQLVSSKRWQDYEKAKLVWVLGGGFNSSNIPSFDKWFSVTDLPDIKINK